MTTFTGGTPVITFSNDDLYRLGQSIAGAAAPTPPSAQWPVPGYLCTDLPWVSTTSATRLILPMLCEEKRIIRFTVGPSGSALISMAEYAASPTPRHGVISAGAADFVGNPKNISNGLTLVWNIKIQQQEIPNFLCLWPNQTYYINIENTACSPGQNCQMFLDLGVYP